MSTIEGLASKIISGVLNPLIQVLFVVAVLIFFWGIIQYVIGSQGDQKQLDQGKSVLKWGIIGLTIMVAATFIVQAVCNTFGADCNTGLFRLLFFNR